VIRGTPLLIQVYLIYYGLGQLEWIQARWDGLALDAFQGAGLLRPAGVQPEHRRLHRRDAGRCHPRDPCRRDRGSAGLRHEPRQVMWRIVLPSALRRTLPAYSNEVVMMLHSTSLASAVPSCWM
jgi:arginine/ornithine transport system permease protein